MSTVQLGEHATLIRGITFKPVDKCAPEGRRRCRLYADEERSSDS